MTSDMQMAFKSNSPFITIVSMFAANEIGDFLTQEAKLMRLLELSWREVPDNIGSAKLMVEQMVPEAEKTRTTNLELLFKFEAIVLGVAIPSRSRYICSVGHGF